MGRFEHKFEFEAQEIAAAAAKEADYHEGRALYWSTEYERAVARVESTCFAKVVRRPVTGGFEADVVVDYGDPAAYSRMQQSFRKMNQHRGDAAAFRVDEQLYMTQEHRPYELSVDDVHHYRIGMPERDIMAEDEMEAVW